jgi:hypothetical protein
MRHGVLSIWLLLLVLTTVSFANEGQGDDQFNAAPTQVADHLLDRFSVRLAWWCEDCCYHSTLS